MGTFDCTVGQTQAKGACAAFSSILPTRCSKCLSTNTHSTTADVISASIITTAAGRAHELGAQKSSATRKRKEEPLLTYAI
jgi:hypothetical protein